MTTDKNINNAADKKPQKKTKSGPRGEFKVVFKGKLLPGFDMERVIGNIVQLTKLPPEKIKKKFFSGKVVIIRRAHDEPHAQKLQQLFTNAGLEVFILRDVTKKISQDAKLLSSKQKQKQSAKKLKRSAKKYNRAILATVLWGVFLVMGVKLWNTYNVSVDVPDAVVDIEYSFANKPLLLMAHINLERLLSRQDYFVDRTEALSGEKPSVYKQLEQAGFDFKKSIKQIVSVAYIENQRMISQTVLLGQFSVDAVKRFLVKNYNGKVISSSGITRMTISELDESTCQQTNLMELSVEPERILISSDGYLDDLHQLLKQQAGTMTDLSDWKAYRSEKLISLAFFDPKRLNSNNVKSGPASSLPMMLTQDLIKKNQPADSLYASLGLQLIPPAGLLDVTINSQNKAWLNSTQSELLKQIEEMKSKSIGLNSLQRLLDKLTLEKVLPTENSEGQTGQLSMTLELDREFKKSIELSLRELSEKFFSVGLGGGVSGSNQKQVGEKIDTAPLKYWPQYNQSKFKPFNEDYDQFFKPAWIEGPFAISLDELLLESHEEGDQVVLQLRGKAQNIDNIGNKQAKIRITEVNDEQGQNVLAAVKCGQPTSDDAYFSSLGGLRTAYVNNKEVTYNELEVRQKVKLQQGIKFKHVKNMQGVIELNLATQTQSKEVAKTEQNLVIAEYGTRLLFKPSSIDSLSYTLSGNENKILAVRALNGNKDYLSRMSRSSMGNLFGGGLSIAEKYYGQIAFIEVVYATRFEAVTYPFTISKFPPYPSQDHWKYELEFAKLSSIKSWNEKNQDVEPLSLVQENNWNGDMQASWHEGPFNLALYALKTNKHFATSGLLMIKTPLIDELTNNLSALEIYIKSPQADENGAMGRSYFFPLKAKGYYMNGEFVADRDKPYMDGQLRFGLPYKNEEKPLTEINGDVVVHLAVSKHNTSFTDMSIGAIWEDEGLKMKLVRLGNEVMEFEVSGKRDQLLQITLIDSNQQRISTTDIQQSSQSWAKSGNIIVNYHGIPVKALLTVSEGQQTRRYPFSLKLK